jgi:hypothetical protein
MKVYLLRCNGPVVAHSVESLRCEGSDAIGAKRTCRERRKRVDMTKMTHLRHWLCTAAMVLMPGLSSIKVLVSADTMLSPDLRRGYAATRTH